MQSNEKLSLHKNKKESQNVTLFNIVFNTMIMNFEL